MMLFAGRIGSGGSHDVTSFHDVLGLNSQTMWFILSMR
ncbi:hypothetical protein EDO6_05606 [Paenibacillus xylanexedens]|nr:hypothetical protein EDO6_05606 [Paenibacillus xylanexedens]